MDASRGVTSSLLPASAAALPTVADELGPTGLSAALGMVTDLSSVHPTGKARRLPGSV